MFSLTTTHLRFICEATTPLHLEVENFRAGQNLRGALGQVMTRTYCAGDRNDPSHAASCPVHWLLAANEKPGQERRGYTLVPPMPRADAPPGRLDPPCRDASVARLRGDVPSGRDVPSERLYELGERFEFGITLFGNARKFLPYFVLAIPEMGRDGIGAGRGKFALKSVWAENPFTPTGERECLLAEGENLVHTPTLTMTHDCVLSEAERLMQCVIASTFATLSVNSAKQSPASKLGIACFDLAQHRTLQLRGELDAAPLRTLLAMTVTFVTPMRLIEDDRLTKAPAFKVLFARLLKRLDDLAEQHAGGIGRPMEEIQSLESLAEQVRLVESETHWVEVWSGSNRRGASSPLGGIVGRATYAAPVEVWELIAPWLLWGQLAQVGKSTVKGNGIIVISD